MSKRRCKKVQKQKANETIPSIQRIAISDSSKSKIEHTKVSEKSVVKICGGRDEPVDLINLQTKIQSTGHVQRHCPCRGIYMYICMYIHP
jgi:hypothetical protein